MLFIFIVVCKSQLTILNETYNILPNNYLQLGEVIGDVQQQNFNVGKLIITQLLQGENFDVILTPYNNSQYSCVVSQFEFPVSNISKCNTFPSNESGCPSDITFNSSSENYQYYQGCNNTTIHYFNQEIKGNSLSLSILILLNPIKEAIQIKSTYTIQIDNSVSFYQISLILCILLGICTVIFVSVLCILNHKFQQVKQQNITLSLQSRQDDYTKQKLM